MKNIPVINVKGTTLAGAYEKALYGLYKDGIRISTQYDKEGEPQSLDATVNITIDEPLTDPMIHKAFPGGIEDLREYVMELQGVKDHWIKNMDDKEDTRWEYTYHQRLSKYGKWKEKNEWVGNIDINQVEKVIDKLSKQPFTRQAQMITWMPNIDFDVYDPPCLQSLWYRIVEENDVWYLNCNIRFRSNDAWGANFMNMFGFTLFNKEIIADEIAKRTGKKVLLGRMNWHADNYHIYGKNIDEAESRLFSKIKSDNPIEDRVWNFWDESIQEYYLSTTDIVNKKIQEVDTR